MIGRNSPCLCGSGRRYKQCCGRVYETAEGLLDQPQPPYLALKYRALELQRAGDSEAAAEAYEAVLGQVPDEPDALNMLGVIRASQGHLEEAFTHVRRAGELTGWANQLVNHNYRYVARTILANVESRRVARQR